MKFNPDDRIMIEGLPEGSSLETYYHNGDVGVVIYGECEEGMPEKYLIRFGKFSWYVYDHRMVKAPKESTVELFLTAGRSMRDAMVLLTSKLFS